MSRIDDDRRILEAAIKSGLGCETTMENGHLLYTARNRMHLYHALARAVRILPLDSIRETFMGRDLTWLARCVHDLQAALADLEAPEEVK